MREDQMPGRLDGKVAIVTGAGRGNGLAIATVFAREGARVLVVDKDADVAQQAAAQIGQAGGDAAAFSGDVSKADDMEAMARAATEHYGGLDILAANAGIYPPTKLEEMTEADWDLVMNVNLKSLFLGVRACIPRMKTRGGGRIVVTSSITGPRVGIPGMTHYAASKGGINGFIRNAALELAQYQITVNGIEPGSVLTPGLQALMSKAEIETLTQVIPLKRLATPQDIGHAVLFLASDEASYITGQTIIVDGGQILPESKLAIL
jgi:3-oxoacyl-[acyl-carrier protein] reductase